MKYLKRYNAHENYVEPSELKAVVSYCKQEEEVHFKNLEYDYSQDYLTFESLKDNNIFKFYGKSSSNFQTIQISVNDGLTWEEKTSSTEGTLLCTLNKGQKVLIKSTTWHRNSVDNNSTSYNSFNALKQFIAYGNIMSLLYGDEFQDKTSLTVERTFQYLFMGSKIENCSNLVLPATSLITYCYYHMFNSCTNLIYPPKKLPALTLSSTCYGRMFQGCTKLVETPDILAQTLAADCCYYMFTGCTNLAKISKLRATSLVSQCYYAMFQNCTSIEIIPEFTVNTVGQDCCAYMFDGCTKLTNTPILAATTNTVRNYRSMFKGCTSLEIAPDLPALSLVNNCYYEMFSGCTKLRYVKAMFTTTPGTNLNNWLYNVSPTGTFVKNANATWELSGPSGIPEGWTVETATA